jgi:hypothetical protein
MPVSLKLAGQTVLLQTRKFVRSKIILQNLQNFRQLKSCVSETIFTSRFTTLCPHKNHLLRTTFLKNPCKNGKTPDRSGVPPRQKKSGNF